MKLRQRLVLTFVGITLLMLGPTLYGLFALGALRQVAVNLSTRDAVGALNLGRLQTAFREVESRQAVYVAFAAQDRQGSPEERAAIRSHMAAVDAELARLAAGGYGGVTAPAAQVWDELKVAIEEEQRLAEAGQAQAQEAFRQQTVTPLFAAMDRALSPIGEAINQAGVAEAQRAEIIATNAATTMLLALTVSLAVALLIGAWSARSLLRPIGQLRRGMAVVAEGNFDGEVAVQTQRPDELGDLARSFSWMTGQLAALDRLKAEFVSVASHELKTPLSVIKGYVSLLQEGVYGPVPETQTKILGSVSDQADRLGRLIQQLLDISRFEAGGGRLDIRPIEMKAFFQDLASSFDALAIQNQIDFRIRLEDSLPETIEGDADRLNEVVGNLLSNAFKFTPRGGRIELRALAGRDNGEEEVVIETRDTGVGIPPDQLPRIFEKFYQVENEAQPKSVGSGLGLAIAREIVEAHGGTISAESELRKGTTFRVLLPVRPTAPEG
jgi:signal transduction histidine kinase